MLRLTTKNKRAVLAAPRRAAPTILAVGPWHFSEFAHLRRELDPNNQWPTAPTLSAAIDQTAAAPAPPEIILLAQPRPSVEDQPTIDRLLTLAPLTRIIAVPGAWCEGELRTGRPLHGAHRLYWHELPAWWRESQARLAAGRPPLWSAPPDSRPLLTSPPQGEDPLQRSGRPPKHIAINTPHQAAYESLAAALTPNGWRPAWIPRHRPFPPNAAPFQAAIFDAAQLDPSELASLQSFATPIAPSHIPLIVLLDFPRPEHINAARAAGATAILGKPYQVSDLLRQLDAWSCSS
jgi:hypothetical protein